jgi:hypothetical protein
VSVHLPQVVGMTTQSFRNDPAIDFLVITRACEQGNNMCTLFLRVKKCRKLVQKKKKHKVDAEAMAVSRLAKMEYNCIVLKHERPPLRARYL